MFAALALAVQAQISFGFTSGTGLDVSVGGVPLVRGSWFQYYEPGWTKGYYSQFYNSQTVEKKPNGVVAVSFRSEDGRAHGTQTFTTTPTGLVARYTFGWEGDKPVLVEMTPGMLWTPPLAQGTLHIDGKAARSLRELPAAGSSLEARTFGAGKSFRFAAPFAEVEMVGSGDGWTIFDARGYNQDWALGRDLLWPGQLAVQVAKGQPANLEVEWKITPKLSSAQGVASASLRSAPLKGALQPLTERMPLVPQPKEVKVDYQKPLILTSGLAAPLRYGTIFQFMLANLWDVRGLTGPAQVRGSFRNIGLPREGYEITVTAEGARVVGQDALGLRHGLRTLAMLAYVHNGKLALPQGTIRDWPSNPWRGVHLFIGPKALDFQSKLWDRVLLPMKLNKVVLQVERANWRAVPGTETPITMDRDELVRLVMFYRRMMVEVIPLIQSFGHMEWLFANGKNLDLAYSADGKSPPDVLYSVDPRKPRTRELLQKLWDEVNTILKPKVFHFGLDEVDMRGFKGDDDELVTQLWEMHLPFLGSIAKKYGLQMMLWGDQALAPGEAPDAALGDSAEHAKRRRKAIPEGAWITDWHYKADSRPETFLPSLRLWKAEGFKPIASTWFRPENVRGFFLAAQEEGAGMLQTTWAGYESNEENMIRELRQFTAMILAADYAWSGRKDPPEALGYEPDALFRRLYFGAPASLTTKSGVSLATGQALAEVQLGEVRFRLFKPLTLGSLVGSPANAPEVRLTTSTAASELALALDADVKLTDGEELAQIVVTLQDGKKVERTVTYGREARAAGDNAATLLTERVRGLSVLRIPLGDGVKVTSITVSSRSKVAGLRIHGITALP